MKEMSPSRLLSYSVLILLSFMGIVGAFWRMTEGLKVTSMTAFEPWGIWVVVYSFLVGVSGGCVLFSSLYTVFGLKEFKEVSGPALLVSLISLAGGILFIWLELGQPFKVLNLYLYPNWDTAMARLAWLYPLLMIAIVSALYLLQKSETSENKKFIRQVGLTGFILVLWVNWDLGNVFTNYFPQHLWSRELTPAVYWGLAIISGLAMGLVLYSAYSKHSANYLKVARNLILSLLLAVGIYIVFVFEEMIRNESTSHILWGDHSWMFLAGQVGLLIFIPMVLGGLGKPNQWPTYFSLAGGSVLGGVFVSRMYALIPASAVPKLNDMETIYHGSRLAASGMWPNLLETVVVLGLLALFVLAFMVLNEFFGKWISVGSLNE